MLTRRQALGLLGGSIVCGGACSRTNLRPFDNGYPPHLPPITKKYHVCDKCGSLDGGIYGKGPTDQYRTEQGKMCVHAWRGITREDFVALAVSRFNVDRAKAELVP
jgi:hypothetical protein